MNDSQPFCHRADRFADIQVLRYRVPGFEALDPRRKELLYYLYEAALCGRDIVWDQNYKHNLLIRHMLEAVIRHFPGNREKEEFEQLRLYVKRVWFASGIHHHYSGSKFEPGFSAAMFGQWAHETGARHFPLEPGQTLDQLLDFLEPILFDPTVDAKKVCKDAGVDVVRASAVNFYEGLNTAQVESYHRNLMDPADAQPVSHGLNSKLEATATGPVERVWKVGGMYGAALTKVAQWLELAVEVAENAHQAEVLRRLVAFYRSGDLREFDAASIAWVADTESVVDLINGFIEVYNDPLGHRATFESVVYFVDPLATLRIETIASHADWFEANSPIMNVHKKDRVVGITGRVINVVVESGDCSPASPIGINLPNAEWIRERYGSKSVNLANIVTAHNQAKGPLVEEFAFSDEEIERATQFGELSDNLHTDMHEVIGHASGKVNPGVGTPKDTLRNYASTLEEARADLVALYYLLDPKLVTLGLMPNLDVGRAQYEDYIRNGLMVQLRRLQPGERLEEDHMRNRQLIAAWALKHGDPDRVIERRERDGKTYFVINDFEKLRLLFGALLREIQRIKSEGDFDAGRALVEEYGVRVDEALHREVLERTAGLNLAAYNGFINPRLVPVLDQGRIRDVCIEYPTDFSAQMLEYADRYGLLPMRN